MRDFASCVPWKPRWNRRAKKKKQPRTRKEPRKKRCLFLRPQPLLGLFPLTFLFFSLPLTPPHPSIHQITSEAEVARILPIARALSVPITFRAAGTSLSGQAITDSVLLKLSHTGRAFRSHEVHGDGSRVTVEPGLIGGEVNAILARHAKKNKLPVQYKIGPDPSSIDSCMVGGIVSNNSSGMCCGVSQNTYHTLAELRAVFADGTVLDTADPASVASFEKTHAELLRGVSDLARRVQADAQLSALIRRKFAIKCTTGYSLNALVDFPADRPVEIVKRLLVGSEGTLAFVSRVSWMVFRVFFFHFFRFCVFDFVFSFFLSFFFSTTSTHFFSCFAILSLSLPLSPKTERRPTTRSRSGPTRPRPSSCSRTSTPPAAPPRSSATRRRSTPSRCSTARR